MFCDIDSHFHHLAIHLYHKEVLISNKWNFQGIVQAFSTYIVYLKFIRCIESFF